jgi:DNA-binding transcriptional MocR family regulator
MDPSYQLLADKLHRQIEARTYLPGDRLPSVRELAKDHGFSLEHGSACLPASGKQRNSRSQGQERILRART